MNEPGRNTPGSSRYGGKEPLPALMILASRCSSPPCTKARDSSLASIFSLLVWLGGWMEERISAALPSLLSSRLKMEGKHHLTLPLATQLPEYLFSLQLQAQDK